jgi:hypothetical protein
VTQAKVPIAVADGARWKVARAGTSPQAKVPIAVAEENHHMSRESDPLYGLVSGKVIFLVENC